MRGIRKVLAAWRRETAGAAAVEFALIMLLLLLPTLNIVDFAVYAFSRMQVENAGEMGAQAAWSACNNNTPGRLPATGPICSGFATAVTFGIHSTFLGNNVSLVSGSPSEGYYCATTSGALVLVGTAGTVGAPPTPPSPDTCDAVAGHSAPNGTAPGDYVQIGVTYTYKPLFTGVTIASLLNPTITNVNSNSPQGYWTRLD